MIRLILLLLALAWLVACATVNTVPKPAVAWLNNAEARLIASAQATTSSVPQPFTPGNWDNSIKQKDAVQVYIVQTPDFFQVIEQERPRAIKTFNTRDEAIAFANHAYPDWPLVPLVP